MNRSTFKNFLISRFIIAAVIPIFCIGFISYSYLSHTTYQNLIIKNELLVSFSSAEIQRFFQIPKTALKQIGLFTLSHTHENDEVTYFLDEMVQEGNFFESVYIINKANQLTTIGLPEGLRTSRQNYIGADMSGHTYIKTAIMTGRPQWSNIFVSPVTGNSILSYAIPIDHLTIVGNFNLSKVYDEISQQQSSHGISSFIVDSTGTIIFHDQKKLVNEQLNVSNLMPIAKAAQGEFGTFKYQFNKVKYLGSTALLPEVNWVLVVSQQKKQAFEPVQKIALFFVIGLLISAIIVAVWGKFVAKMLLRPLELLHQHIKKISTGKYTATLPAQKHDEIEHLANEFRIMVNAVEEREDTLKKSELRYREIFNSPHDAIFIHDAQNGAILDINQAALEMFGYSRDELLTIDLGEISLGVPPYTLEEATKKVASTLTVGPQTFEWHSRKKDKTLFWSEVSLKHRKLMGNDCVIGVVRNISERKQLEQEILKAKKLESVGVLAGGIAHDFNNILAAILGNINLASMYTKPSDKIHNLLIEAEKACLRAKDLTQQLLTFSKGGEPVKLLSSVTQVIKDSTNFNLRGSKIRADFSLPDKLWLLEIDTGQISQVIQNLIINARQAMTKGGVISISASNITLEETNKHKLTPGKYVTISITDQGEGVDPQIISHIFDPYFSTKKSGSGLGLAIAYAIIDKHNGHLSVHSDLNQGTTFTILLPANTTKFPPPEIDNVEPQKSKKSVKILVMDDEEMIQNVLDSMLNHLGHKVVTAKDGDTALEIYQEAMKTNQAFDCIIMDLTIPGGKGGEETIKEVLALNPDAKVIAASGYSNDPIMANYAQYGFCEAITKPFQLKDLEKIIQKIL